MFLYQFGKLGDGHGNRHSHDLRPRRHDLAHRFVTELNHRLDEVAVALLQDSFFLAGFDQRVYCF